MTPNDSPSTDHSFDPQFFLFMQKHKPPQPGSTVIKVYDGDYHPPFQPAWSLLVPFSLIFLVGTCWAAYQYLQRRSRSRLMLAARSTRTRPKNFVSRAKEAVVAQEYFLPQPMGSLAASDQGGESSPKRTTSLTEESRLRISAIIDKVMTSLWWSPPDTPSEIQASTQLKDPAATQSAELIETLLEDSLAENEDHHLSVFGEGINKVAYLVVDGDLIFDDRHRSE